MTIRFVDEQMKLLIDSKEKIKFLCSEIWLNLFGKQADDIKKETNGPFIVTETPFYFLESISSNDIKQEKNLKQLFIIFLVALIESILKNIGLQTRVEITENSNNSYVFKIHLI